MLTAHWLIEYTAGWGQGPKRLAATTEDDQVVASCVSVRVSSRWRSARSSWRSCWRLWTPAGSWRCLEQGPPVSSVLSAACSTKERYDFTSSVFLNDFRLMVNYCGLLTKMPLTDAPDPDNAERPRPGKEVPQRAYWYSGECVKDQRGTFISRNSQLFFFFVCFLHNKFNQQFISHCWLRNILTILFN